LCLHFSLFRIGIVKDPNMSAATLLDNAKNGFVVRTADAIYGEGDTSGRIYDGRPVRDTPSNRLLGWQRICLLVSFFGPSSLYDPQESFDTYAGRPFVFPVVSPAFSSHDMNKTLLSNLAFGHGSSLPLCSTHLASEYPRWSKSVQ
jgi:hypothetical protein